jgi:hypothetical protein
LPPPGSFRGEYVRCVEIEMSGEQILEAVTYLTWASSFGVLAICLGAAVISYRRWVNKQPQRHDAALHGH